MVVSPPNARIADVEIVDGRPLACGVGESERAREGVRGHKEGRLRDDEGRVLPRRAPARTPLVSAKGQGAPCRQGGMIAARRDDPVSARRDDPVSARRDDPVSTRRDDPVSARRDDPVSTGRDDPVSARRGTGCGLVLLLLCVDREGGSRHRQLFADTPPRPCH